MIPLSISTPPFITIMRGSDRGILEEAEEVEDGEEQARMRRFPKRIELYVTNVVSGDIEENIALRKTRRK